MTDAPAVYVHVPPIHAHWHTYDDFCLSACGLRWELVAAAGLAVPNAALEQGR